MDKEDLLELVGNVLLGITCPFLFLVSNNPYKDLYNNVREVDKDGRCK